MPKQYIETENRRPTHKSVSTVADFTEVVFKSVAYRLSGRACQFLFLVLSLSGSQTNFPVSTHPIENTPSVVVTLNKRVKGITLPYS